MGRFINERGIRCQLGVPFGDSSSVLDCAGTSYSRSSLEKDSAACEIRIHRRVELRGNCCACAENSTRIRIELHVVQASFKLGLSIYTEDDGFRRNFVNFVNWRCISGRFNDLRKCVN